MKWTTLIALVGWTCFSLGQQITLMVAPFDSSKSGDAQIRKKVSVILNLLVGAVASVPRWSAVGVLLAPGMLAAAIVFPEGTNSDWGKTYLVLAALMNAFLLAWPVLWFWTWIEHFRRRN